MDKQKFVKLDSQYYQVLLNDKGLYLEKVDIMAYLQSSVEKTVLGNEVVLLPEDEDNIMQQVIDETRAELKLTLKKSLSKTILSILGFEEDSWGRKGFSVDHCNGRMSDVTSLIANELKDILLNVKIDTDFTLTSEEIELLREGMRKDFIEKYKCEIHNAAYSAARNLAKDDVQQVANELIGAKKVEIATSILDSLMRSRPKN